MQAPGTWLHNRLTLDFQDMADHGMAPSTSQTFTTGAFFLIWPTPGRQCAGGRSTYMRQMSQEYMLVSFHHWMERWGNVGDVWCLQHCEVLASCQLVSWPWLAQERSSGWMVPTRGLRILTIHETSFYHWRSLTSQCSETVLTAIWSTPRKIDMIHLKITQLEFGESSEPNSVIFRFQPLIFQGFSH